MKRNLLLLVLALCLFGTSHARTEGLLPSLVDTISKPMLSLGEALGRYPDEEIPEADGGTTEVFKGVTETDFNMFSVYLKEKGATLADYQAVGSSFSASIQIQEKTISFAYDTQTLEATVTYPKGTYDKWLDYAKTQCESVVQLLNEGKPDEALSVLFTIPYYRGYGPAAYLEGHPKLVEAAAHEANLAPFRTVGGYVTFGSYEQDNNTGNGKEPIEWLVLDYDEANHCALLLSRYGLDVKPYVDFGMYKTWDQCSLRTWLNEEFLNNAFSKAEQGAIQTTDVDNSKSQDYDRWIKRDGYNTQDKVFLLSYAEANKYLGVTERGSDNKNASVSPTAYSLKAGASYTDDVFKTADGITTTAWMLRSPGTDDMNVMIVYSNGKLSDTSAMIGNCVRPALWINLESDFF